MNDIAWTKPYEDYKNEVGQELTRASESFVRIGYLLKVARDTEVLKDSDYGVGNYIQFAEKEFGLEKTQVSRFIRINDRFSEGGNSDVLKEEYRGYGTRKLGIMLTLPDELTEELSPDYTVEEMETIQKEVQQEQEITPLEHYAESLEAEKNKEKAAELAKDDILGAALYQILEDKPDLYEELDGCLTEQFKGILSPIEDTLYICRPKGVGKLMVICKEEKITIVNARTSEKQFFTWDDAQDAFLYITEHGCGGTAKENWETIYGKPFPENDKKEPKIDKNPQKTEEKGKKTSKKAKVVVTKETKDAKKEQPSDSKPEEHESAGEGDEERTREIKAGAGERTEKELSNPAAEPVHDNRPQESIGETGDNREADLGGAEGEPSPSGTGEALPGEDTGTAGREGDASYASGRNKYSGRIENLVWKSGMIVKELKAGSENYEEALVTAKDIRQCIDSIITDLKKEEKPAWREIK